MKKCMLTLTITFDSTFANMFLKNNLPGSLDMIELLGFHSAGFGFTQELLHTFLAWNSYPHMKISWFQLIMADFDDRSWQKIAIFLPPFQSQAMRCKIRTRWAMRIIFYSSDTPRVIFLPWDHLKKGGGKGCAYLLSAQTSRYNMFFFHQCFMLESYSKLSERTPFRPPFFKWSRAKNMTRGVSLE